HRHPEGVVEAGERQHRRGGRVRRQLQHPIVAKVGDVDVAGAVHRHTAEAGERQHGWVAEPAANFTTRLFPESATYTLPAASTASPSGFLRPVNDSTVCGPYSAPAGA